MRLKVSFFERGGPPHLIGGTMIDASLAGRREAWLAYALVSAFTLIPAAASGADATTPVDGKIAYVSTDLHWSRGMRFQLSLTDKNAEGLMAGYADTHWSTHHRAYGQLDPSGFHRKLNQLADDHPDKDRKMTAISSSDQLGDGSGVR